MSDVAGRLAQGETAVEHLAGYSSACAALGSTDPGLAGRLREAYAREAGLDLHALDADHAALTAAAETVRAALDTQDGQLSALHEAWEGNAAEAALEVLRRHGEAASQAAAALDRAADSMAQLREDLWRIVDAKVEATQSLDGRTDAVRDEWTAAAETVTSGAGDRAAASELVDQHVTPFVARDVATDLVVALEEASDAIDRSFDSAIGTVRDQPVDTFPAAGGGGWAPAAAGAGLGAATPWTSTAGSPMSPPSVADPMAGAAGMPPSSATSPMSMPGSSGLSDVGSGLSGLGRQFGELFGGLLPTGDDLGDVDELKPELDEPEADELELDEPEADEPEADEPDEDDQPEEDEAEEDELAEEDAAEEYPAEEDPAVDPPTAEEPAQPPGPEDASVEVPPTPTPAAPLADVGPPTAPVPATPCEIAADELPQAGG